MVKFLPLMLGLIYVIGAYMQSGPIKIIIHVLPPNDLVEYKRGNVWKLGKLPYGIMKSGPQ